jgi:hypothetical protein
MLQYFAINAKAAYRPEGGSANRHLFALGFVWSKQTRNIPSKFFREQKEVQLQQKKKAKTEARRK